MAVRFIDSQYEYSSGYYTTNKWIDGYRIVLARSKSFSEKKEISLVLFNLHTWTEEVLVEKVESWDSYLVDGDRLIYTNNNTLMEIQIQTKKAAELFRSEREEHILSPHITNDGVYISFYQTIENITYFWRYNRKENTCILICKKKFADPFYYANHGMICPADPNLMFFAHEGDTTYITNRLWTARLNGEMKNIAPQRLDENGVLQDCFGHEMWAPDGKGLYFVKYPCSPSAERGICYVETEGKRIQFLYSDYGYWHVSVTKDQRYLIADTQSGSGDSEVVVVDQKTGEQRCIARTKLTWVHPCHPHPQMNPEHTIVCFTGLNEKGRTSTAFVDFAENENKCLKGNFYSQKERISNEVK